MLERYRFNQVTRAETVPRAAHDNHAPHAGARIARVTSRDDPDSRELIDQLRRDATRREDIPANAPKSPSPVPSEARETIAEQVARASDHETPERDPVASSEAEGADRVAGADMAANADAPEIQRDLTLTDDIGDKASPPALRYSGQGWHDLPVMSFPNGETDTLRAQSNLVGGDDRIIRVIDDLRTQLLRSLESETWKRIAVTGPTSGCGATFTALNLALSLSRIPDFRTVLMDFNQRNPAIAATLGIKAQFDLGRILRGEVPAKDHMIRMSETLAIGLNTERQRNPSEILHARRTHEILDDMIADLDPDIVIYDLPAMLDYDDVSAFLPQVDGVLLVADASRTLGAQIEECERRLAGKTPLLGVILNRCRADDGPRVAA